MVWGKLAQFAASFTKSAHIEVEGELRHRTDQKQVQAGKETVAVDVTAAEIHATTIHKLDRNGSSASAGEEEVSEEAPELSALGICMRTSVNDVKLELMPATLFVVRITLQL